ncbi:MAG: hypothetical protein ACRCRT_02995 [Cetobacterium somerae]
MTESVLKLTPKQIHYLAKLVKAEFLDSQNCDDCITLMELQTKLFEHM